MYVEGAPCNLEQTTHSDLTSAGPLPWVHVAGGNESSESLVQRENGVRHLDGPGTGNELLNATAPMSRFPFRYQGRIGCRLSALYIHFSPIRLLIVGRTHRHSFAPDQCSSPASSRDGIVLV